MKRTSFKKKPTVLKRSTLRKSKKSPKLEAWIRAIPESQAHGSGTLQKRLWRLRSDFVRIRDWTAFNGFTVDGKRLEHWSHGQAGHLKPYSNCNGLFKFNEMNIHLQSAASNKWGNRDDWKAYEAELVRRYGQEFVDAIEETNKYWPLKFTTEQVKNEMRRTIRMLGVCKEQPEYYKRVTELLNK